MAEFSDHCGDRVAGRLGLGQKEWNRPSKRKGKGQRKEEREGGEGEGGEGRGGEEERERERENEHIWFSSATPEFIS